MATRMLNLNNLTSSIGASLPNPLRSKKKYHFDVTLTLQELEHCTYVSGVLFAKLQLKDGGTFNGSSHRNDVENHGVQWDEDFNFSCKMYTNTSTMVLEPCYCKISIRKETKGGKSYTKLGYVRINLAEFAGQGTKQRKYLIQSYNESKHKPDNSLLKVKLYLRQTSGDIVFKAPETKLQPWEISGEDDEGFHDDLRSIYSRGTPRASNGSTLSSFSSVTGGTWSSHSGSAGNLKSHDSFGEISSKEVSTEEDQDQDQESGSEETVIEKASSQVTMDTIRTGSSSNNTKISWKTAETVSSSRNNSRTSSPCISPSRSTTPSGTQTGGGGASRRVSSPDLISPQSPSNLQCSSNVKFSSAPIIVEEAPHTDPLSPKNFLPTDFDPNRRHTDSFRFCKSENDDKSNELKVPNITTATGNPGSLNRHISKGGASVQTSPVTAVPGGGSSRHYHHHRQASMGTYHHSPSPLTMGHRRHNSISTYDGHSETQSMFSAKTRVSTLSTIEQSRADNSLVIAGLIASHDLTPASDDDSESNLKLYIDKHGGGVTIAGHNLSDKYRFKEVDVSSMEELRTNNKSRKRHSKAMTPEHSSNHSDSGSSDSQK